MFSSKEVNQGVRQEGSTKSYAAATKSDTMQNNAELLGAINEVIAKSVMCIVVSAMKNAKAPGTLTGTMNQVLKANTLPKFSLLSNLLLLQLRQLLSIN